jgi:hypothetical protein
LDLCPDLDPVSIDIGQELPHKNAIILEFVSFPFDFGEFQLDVGLDLGQ